MPGNTVGNIKAELGIYTPIKTVCAISERRVERLSVPKIWPSYTAGQRQARVAFRT